MVDQILSVYTTTLNIWAKNHPQDSILESLAFSTYLKGISDKVDQAIAESNLSDDRARILQDELDSIRGSLTWRLYQKVHRILFVHNLYGTLITHIRHWYAYLKKRR